MRERGFTMIEVMAVVLLISIVATMAIPMMRNLAVQGALTSSTNDVVAAVASARSHAVAEAVQFSVKPRSGGWDNGWCVVRGTTDNCEAATGNVITLYAALNNTVTVKSGPAANPVFERNGVNSGIATGATASVLICEKNGSHSRQIIFNRSGSTTVNKDVSGC